MLFKSNKYLNVLINRIKMIIFSKKWKLLLLNIEVKILDLYSEIVVNTKIIKNNSEIYILNLEIVVKINYLQKEKKIYKKK